MSRYEAPDEQYISVCATSLYKLFQNYVNLHGGQFISFIKLDAEVLRDCITRVHKRKYYFQVFHDMPGGLSEVKRIAIYCSYLLRYRPFFLEYHSIPENSSQEQRDILSWRRRYFLERFCVYLLDMVLTRLASTTVRLPLSSNGIEDFVYSLRHHDVSREGLIEMFEMLEDIALG